MVKIKKVEKNKAKSKNQEKVNGNSKKVSILNYTSKSYFKR